MHSPLPDSSALEAGIIEDARPSRLSRVQDNVRNLLRSSIIASAVSSPRAPSFLPSPVETRQFAAAAEWTRANPADVLPSPTESVATIASSDSAGSEDSTTSQRSTDALLPAIRADRLPQQAREQSAMYNSRAIAALNHPDLSDTVLAIDLQEDIRRRQRRAWKRCKRHELQARVAKYQILLCVVIGLALAGLLSTYIALAITTTTAPAIFHILFIIGILLVLIAFMHSLARLVFVPAPPARRRHKSRHRARYACTSHGRTVPVSRDQFLPSEPIPVTLETDDVLLDPSEAQPSSAVHQPPEIWTADGAKSVTHPPPAYGRWRGSVRVNPELLHWQPVTSPPGTPAIPSPTYEEAQNIEGGAGSPPSYKTEDSPARRRADHAAMANNQEMIEGRGIGLA